MKITLLHLTLILMTGSLIGSDIALPISLEEFERFIEEVSADNQTETRPNSTICITVATGGGNTIREITDLELNPGSTIEDAAIAWARTEGKPLIGWPQGLVVLRRNGEHGVERFSWTQRELREKAAGVKLLDEDWLIALVWSDF